ncbi:hypothetical protein NEMIN01_1662 [Nematocida minor]|uniref:uncharacterized protein n=1 Tax=Nematocida minor TaxID=1912983 RepID=UPI00222013A6|nr:uncharacterized protein NEMIN01_1662 [Nematocida minor]KAI5191771.1 hypothetical protein NEMIN01_1662 [Nematocida minor]
MLMGQVVRLDSYAKRVVNCSIVCSAVALVKNKGVISFLTFSVFSSSSDSERKTFHRICIGAVISANGFSNTVDARQVFACTRNIKIHDLNTVPSEIFEPTTDVYTPFSQMLKNNYAQAMLLIVKTVSSDKGYCIYCVDTEGRYFRVLLCSASHTIKHQDVILLTDVIVRTGDHRTVYTQHLSTIEVNPSIRNEKVAAARNKLAFKSIEVESMDEINRIEEDTSISLKGRILRISMSKNTITIANHAGGIQVKMEKDRLTQLLQQIVRDYKYKCTEDLWPDLVFFKVLLTADIVLLNKSFTIQNMAVALLL